MIVKILETTESIKGNKIELVSTNDSVKESNVLVVGVVHGDEPQGYHIINEYLKRNENKNNLLFIPCLNPDGMIKKTRVNANGVDINRNFPTSNWGNNEGENATCNETETPYYGGKYPSSEIETKFLINIIEKYSPKLVVTIHSPYKVVNYDGDALNIANMISNKTGYPVVASIGYPTPGSFGTYCSLEKNIPVITIELDETCPVENLYNPMFEVFDDELLG